jgi:hypothetical protein
MAGCSIVVDRSAGLYAGALSDELLHLIALGHVTGYTPAMPGRFVRRKLFQSVLDWQATAYTGKLPSPGSVPPLCRCSVPIERIVRKRACRKRERLARER